MNWIFVSTQNSYVEILTPSVVVVGSSAFARWLGHDNRAPMNGISVLILDTGESFLVLFTVWQHGEKTAVHEPMNQEGNLHQTLLVSNLLLPNLQNKEEYIFIVNKPLSLCSLL